MRDRASSYPDIGPYFMDENNFSTLWTSVLSENVQGSFAALTDADVIQIDGNAETFLQLLQQRYGYTLEEAKVAMDTFMNRYNSYDNSIAGADNAKAPITAAFEPPNTPGEVF